MSSSGDGVKISAEAIRDETIDVRNARSLLAGGVEVSWPPYDAPPMDMSRLAEFSSPPPGVVIENVWCECCSGYSGSFVVPVGAQITDAPEFPDKDDMDDYREVTVKGVTITLSLCRDYGDYEALMREMRRGK